MFWQFCVIFVHLFKTEEEKAKTGPTSASKDKGGAKVSDKKGKSPPSPEEKKTKLKRRNDVEPPKFIGKNSNIKLYVWFMEFRKLK